MGQSERAGPSFFFGLLSSPGINQDLTFTNRNEPVKDGNTEEYTFRGQEIHGKYR
jgi:hypothetical protein